MDGTDLSIAYGSAYQPNNYSSGGRGAVGGTNSFKESRVEREPDHSMDLPLPKMSSVPVENPNYKVPADLYESQGNKGEGFSEGSKGKRYASRADQLSFWDKIGQKKIEVFKVFLLSLVIVLGLSLDHISKHYLDKYISTAFLTETQEFLVRLSYPVLILLIIWIIKASA